MAHRTGLVPPISTHEIIEGCRRDHRRAVEAVNEVERVIARTLECVDESHDLLRRIEAALTRSPFAF